MRSLPAEPPALSAGSRALPADARALPADARALPADARALPADFYERPVVEVARELIGCTVQHGGCAGVIVETEAYHEGEPACHAYAGLTPRTSTLFGPPGRAYVYRSYGIHALLNAVCEPEGVGAAVLIRALLPTRGIELMRPRRPRAAREEDLCSGPGKLTEALAIGLELNASDLAAGPVRVLERTAQWCAPPLAVGTRIGITRAAELPWRFALAESRHVSRPWPRGQLPPARGGSAARAAGPGPGRV